jgi:hypothetical protein
MRTGKKSTTGVTSLGIRLRSQSGEQRSKSGVFSERGAKKRKKTDDGGREQTHNSLSSAAAPPGCDPELHNVVSARLSIAANTSTQYAISTNE